MSAAGARAAAAAAAPKKKADEPALGKEKVKKIALF